MQFYATEKTQAGFVAVVFAIFLTGCGGSGSGSSSSSGSTSSQPPSATETVVNGQTVALSWEAPLKRVNGLGISPTDIDGYIVRFGQSPGNLDQHEVLDGGYCRLCYYDVENLAPGTWYFTVQTVDSDGLISSPSEPVSRTI